MRHEGLSNARPRQLSLELLETRWVPANVGTLNQNFIDQVYRDVLHRAPDPGAAGWVSALDGGADREDVVDAILDSDEGLRNQVNDLYVRFLGRAADSGGLTFWTNFLRRDDNTNLDLAAQLISSQEYYQTQGGGTDQGFLDAVYQDVLCRPISSDEVDDRDDDFDDGVEDRLDIAEGILDSGEAEDVRASLSAQSFLRVSVPPDQADDLVDDGGDDAFARSVLSSDQYFSRAQTLTTADFATVPSCDNVPAQPIVVS